MRFSLGLTVAFVLMSVMVNAAPTAQLEKKGIIQGPTLTKNLEVAYPAAGAAGAKVHSASFGENENEPDENEKDENEKDENEKDENEKDENEKDENEKDENEKDENELGDAERSGFRL